MRQFYVFFHKAEFAVVTVNAKNKEQARQLVEKQRLTAKEWDSVDYEPSIDPRLVVDDVVPVKERG